MSIPLVRLSGFHYLWLEAYEFVVDTQFAWTTRESGLQDITSSLALTGKFLLNV